MSKEREGTREKEKERGRQTKRESKSGKKLKGCGGTAKEINIHWGKNG